MNASTGIVLPRRFLAITLGSAFVCVAVVILSSFVGSAPISPWRAIQDPASLDFQIFFRARVPRLIFAALVGGALGVSGLVFQAILRNPLASPFTLGVSGGSALGAVLAIRLGWEISVLGFSFLPLASLLGALAVILVVYGLSRTPHQVSPVTLLLSGVVLNFICAALILFIHYFAQFTESFLMVRWMMGGLDIYNYTAIVNVLPFYLPGLVLLAYQSRYLNVLSGGEDWARSRGVPVKRALALQYFGASLLTGSVIAYSGPIGFVGLVVPHVLRLLFGADHRLLFPACFFGGGAFLILCDTGARTLLSPAEIPVGIVTALLGGPFFLWLLLRRKRETFF